MYVSLNGYGFLRRQSGKELLFSIVAKFK